MAQQRFPLFQFKPRESPTTLNYSALWQWGLLGQLTGQFIEMRNILYYYVPQPGVNVFRPREVAAEVLKTGLKGFAVGATFAGAQQCVKVIRGTHDPFNSFAGGAAVGLVAMACRPNPWMASPVVGYCALPCFATHYFYDKMFNAANSKE
mmetsp:Transcript_15350/g.23110  ORF Transcript_15350/g.23110 Transcript_15350/m.23110 type:complete len:150 (-) Transcript_15350:122-571(-)